MLQSVFVRQGPQSPLRQAWPPGQSWFIRHCGGSQVPLTQIRPWAQAAPLPQGAHWPLTQVWVDGQSVGMVQAGGGGGVTQEPLMQAWPDGHCESMVQAVQVPLTQASPVGQSAGVVHGPGVEPTHVPLRQIWPDGQAGEHIGAQAGSVGMVVQLTGVRQSVLTVGSQVCGQPKNTCRSGLLDIFSVAQADPCRVTVLVVAS